MVFSMGKGDGVVSGLKLLKVESMTISLHALWYDKHAFLLVSKVVP